MPRILTRFFGERDCKDDSLYSFPSGLPGFEEERSFFFLSIPGSEPLLFMQSASISSLCFVLLPVLVADPNYKIVFAPEELAELRLPADRDPVIGRDILCAVMICSAEGAEPTANLMAPIVVNLQAKIGVQLIHGDSGYSHRHPLRFEEELVLC